MPYERRRSILRCTYVARACNARFQDTCVTSTGHSRQTCVARTVHVRVAGCTHDYEVTKYYTTDARHVRKSCEPLAVHVRQCLKTTCSTGLLRSANCSKAAGPVRANARKADCMTSLRFCHVCHTIMSSKKKFAFLFAIIVTLNQTVLNASDNQ